MKTSRLLAALAIASAFGWSGIPRGFAATNLVVNGSFEANPFNGPFILPPAGSTEVTGWTITGGSDIAIQKVPDLAQAQNNSTFGNAQDGFYYLDLSGGRDAPHAAIQQSVPTTPGTTYLLTFYIGASNVFAVAPTISVTVGDVTAPLVSATFTPPPPTNVIQWQKQTFYFRATAAQTLVRFRDPSNFNDEVSYVDAVSVTALPPTINSPAQATGTPGTTFRYLITATGSPTSFSVNGLPAGLSLDPVKGIISGTPKATGTFFISLGASNAGGIGTAKLSLVVSNSPPATPLITSPAAAFALAGFLASGENTFFSYKITASNAPTTFTASPLPTGLSLNAQTGVISGTPDIPGTYPILLTAANAAGSSTATLTLTVVPGPGLSDITSPLAIGLTSNSGKTLNYVLTGSNTPGGFNPTGLPAGISFNSATQTISGVPSATGTFPLEVQVSNAAGSVSQSANLVYGLIDAIIAALQPKIQSDLTASIKVGTPFVYRILATKQPRSFDASPLPAGLSIDRNTGVISGTPTEIGPKAVTLRASNAAIIDNAQTTLAGQADLTLTVEPPSFFNGAAPLSNGVYYLRFPTSGRVFGFYSYQYFPYLFHFDLGFEYFIEANDGLDGAFLYDFASGSFFYTAPGFPFPYLYDFSLNATLFYFPDPNNPDRYNTNGKRFFYNFVTGQVITK